jgi:hypothetical protein
MALAKFCSRLIHEEQVVSGEPYTITFRKGMAGSVTVGKRALVDVRKFQLFCIRGVNVVLVILFKGPERGCSVSKVACVSGFMPYNASNGESLVAE